MEWMKNKRFNGDVFKEEEREVAEALLRLKHGGAADFLQWGAKRRRSRISRGDSYIQHQLKLAKFVKSSPQSPLFWCETDDSEERTDVPYPPAAATDSPPNSKNVKGRNTLRRRPPKKKTHKELKEMVDLLTLERSRLKKEKEGILKSHQDLRDLNSYLKSQLASCLDQRQEQKLLFTSQPTLSCGDSVHGTETSVSFHDSSRHSDHDSSENIASMLDLGSVYDELRHAEKSMYPYSLESSSGSEKDESSRPTIDPSCFLGLPDLNAPIEATCDLVPSVLHEEMVLPKDRVAVAAEARRRRIELTRIKYAHSRKARSK